MIESGKKNNLTATNPLLLNATETANKLSHQLDELNGLVSKVNFTHYFFFSTVILKYIKILSVPTGVASPQPVQGPD